jgi:hypothetical protein
MRGNGPVATATTAAKSATSHGTGLPDQSVLNGHGPAQPGPAQQDPVQHGPVQHGPAQPGTFQGRIWQSGFNPHSPAAFLPGFYSFQRIYGSRNPAPLLPATQRAQSPFLARRRALQSGGTQRPQRSPSHPGPPPQSEPPPPPGSDMRGTKRWLSQ